MKSALNSANEIRVINQVGLAYNLEDVDVCQCKFNETLMWINLSLKKKKANVMLMSFQKAKMHFFQIKIIGDQKHNSNNC